MHPSELEDADGRPLRRPEKNFEKYLKTGQFRNASESRTVDDEGEESSTVDGMPIRRHGVFLCGTRLSESARSDGGRTNVGRT
jgi:hypothetical protein